MMIEEKIKGKRRLARKIQKERMIRNLFRAAVKQRRGVIIIKGIRRIISVSKIRKIILIKKNRILNGTRLRNKSAGEEELFFVFFIIYYDLSP